MTPELKKHIRITQRRRLIRCLRDDWKMLLSFAAIAVIGQFLIAAYLLAYAAAGAQ